MKRVLRFRATDRDIFDDVKRGNKTIETRAATSKFRHLQKGDILVLKCGKESLEKRVQKSSIFPSLNELFREFDYRKISPKVSSMEEAKQVYSAFPRYQKKIAKYGIIALELI